MACFLVPAAEAIVTTIASKAMNKNSTPASEAEAQITFGSKLNWLNNLLWGGSALLAFEHVWHGEVTPFFPFLTAAAEGESAEMLREMGTVGVGMAVLVTGVWVGMVLAAKAIAKRPAKEEEAAEAES
ncbi:MAG: hypothetical protein IKZ41_03190 [Clostridia bacterium]|jgi:hypothetical protein|nr:hypothetical protein [Clostridia bacterium]MBR5365303.1 hypothetical protein [Clostridia bacterium]